MTDLARVVKAYWFSNETNIFKNHIDALYGLGVLVLIPLLSIILTIRIDSSSFWNYSFPLISISLAEIYDVYGRYEYKSSKNTKLFVRIALNCVSIAFSLGCRGCSGVILFFSPVCLCLNGLLLVVEICNRVNYAIKLSKWYVHI